MYSFANDYSEGCIPEILAALAKVNYLQSPGYGVDPYCELATKLIKQQVNREDVDVHFIPGGTPANILAIDCALRSHEAVIAVDSGHINVHEAGSIEGIGHKIVTVKGVDGKITAKEIEDVMNSHTDEHMVKPKMVFISNATEFGTIYHRYELEEISNVCKKYGLYLYLDGARIGNALMSCENDLFMSDIANLVDMFYIGGTKNGALLGEAMVIINDELKKDFRFHLKQRGAMLAKGRILGVQFYVLFKENKYYELAKHADEMAMYLKEAFKNHNIPFYMETTTNQIFPILPNWLLEKIQKDYVVTVWGPYDNDSTIVRFVCSWATKEENIAKFHEDLNSYYND